MPKKVRVSYKGSSNDLPVGSSDYLQNVVARNKSINPNMARQASVDFQRNIGPVAGAGMIAGITAAGLAGLPFEAVLAPLAVAAYAADKSNQYRESIASKAGVKMTRATGPAKVAPQVYGKKNIAR